MSTPTPLTDEAWSSAFNAEDFSASSVARSMRVFSQKIEIELAELTAERDQLRAQLHALRLVCGTTDADKFTTWVDRANARAEKAEAEAERYRLVTLKQDAELATAKERLRSEAMDDYAAIKDLQRELATERGKLDWVFQNCKVEANDYTTGNRDVYYVHDREDLGMAMKEGAK